MLRDRLHPLTQGIEMADRRAHLVGSLPGPDARTAMSRALDLLGPNLGSLPDGETGGRDNWVADPISRLGGHRALERRKGLGGRTAERLRVRRGATLYGATLDLGHVAAARASHPVFQELTGGSADIAFQQGWPGDLDMAVLALGVGDGIRHRRAFTEATLAEIRDVRGIVGASLLAQLEVPVELVLAARAPAWARHRLVRTLAGGVARLAAAAPAGTRFAVHLCVGDQDHRAMVVPDDVGPLVALANEIVRQWPAHNPLVLLHAPFAAGERPANTEPAFLAPLRGLQVPEDVQFAAGFAHEEQDLTAQVGIRDRTEDLLQREVTIAAACGLGRRSETAGTAVLTRMAELCAA